MTDDRETLAKVLSDSHFDGTACGTTASNTCSVCWDGGMTAHEIADAILASQWLADRDAKVRAEALSDGIRAVHVRRLDARVDEAFSGPDSFYGGVVAAKVALRWLLPTDAPDPLASRIARTTDTTSEEKA